MTINLESVALENQLQEITTKSEADAALVSEVKSLSVIGRQLPENNRLIKLKEIFDKAPRDLTLLVVRDVPLDMKVTSSLCNLIKESKSLRHLILDISLNLEAKKNLLSTCVRHPALEEVDARYDLPQLLVKNLAQNIKFREMKDLIELVKEVRPTSVMQIKRFYRKAELINENFNFVYTKKAKKLQSKLDLLLCAADRKDDDSDSDSDCDYVSPPSPTYEITYNLEKENSNLLTKYESYVSSESNKEIKLEDSKANSELIEDTTQNNPKLSM